jgi:glutamine synthetase
MRPADLRAHEAPTNAGELFARVEAAGLEQVRVAWADLHGTHRCKTLVVGGAFGTRALAAALKNGVGLVSTLLLKDSADRTALPVFEPGALDGLAGFGAANNLLLWPEPASFVVLPWAPRTGWLRATPRWTDGRAVEADPRQVLIRALERLAAAGYTLRVGLELEFHVYRQGADPLPAAVDGWPAEPAAVHALHPGHGLLNEAWADRCDAVFATVRRVAAGLGLPLTSLEVEFGPSQVEAVFSATDALTAADHLLAFRNGVRQALAREGWHATFMARPPLPGAMASGWHVHQSLATAGGPHAGSNAFVRRQAGGGAHEARAVLSDAGAHWLAGLLAHAPGLAGLSVPTAVGFERFKGSPMAPTAAHWGFDNRGAMLRVIGGPGDAATRIENRLGEPLANPYLCLAGQVAAGLDGLTRQLEPGPAVRAPYGPQPAPVPATPSAALDALAADAVLTEALGPTMLRVHEAVRRAEIARRAAADDPGAWDRRELFGRF